MIHRFDIEAQGGVGHSSIKLNTNGQPFPT